MIIYDQPVSASAMKVLISSLEQAHFCNGFLNPALAVPAADTDVDSSVTVPGYTRRERDNAGHEFIQRITLQPVREYLHCVVQLGTLPRDAAVVT